MGKVQRLVRLQWIITIVTGILSAIAIGLAFASQGLIAQLVMIPVFLCLVASCAIAYQRYKYNMTRRNEILSQLDAERDKELRDLFDGARKRRNLPPDVASRDGYTSEVKAIKARAEQAADLPPGVKRRGGGTGGKR